MLSDIAELERLLNHGEDQAAVCKKILQTYATNDPETFLRFTTELLVKRSECPGFKCLSEILGTEGVLHILLNIHRQSRDQAIAVAKKLLASNSRLDVMLLEPLQRERFVEESEDMVLRILDILDGISERDRLVLNILAFLKHPNARFRSKAALFIGRRRQSLPWITDHSRELDPRVRANILESLFGSREEFIHRLFLDNVTDENNRVAGNAILGLYLFGDPASIQLIDEMAKDPRPSFRNTSAWIMGKTGDRRFAQNLVDLISDPDELVRRQALRGLSGIKTALKAAATPSGLQLSVLANRRQDEGHNLIATVHDDSDHLLYGLRFTDFYVKAGGRYLREYSVKEYTRSNILDVAFLLCLPAENEAFVHACMQDAVQRCLRLRRPNDRWSIVALTSRTDGSSPGMQFGASANYNKLFRYSNSPQHIESMLRDNPIFITGAADDRATRAVVKGLLSTDFGSATPHLIFLGVGASAEILDTLNAKRSQLPATIHVIAQSPVWQDASIEHLVLSTGGIHKQVDADGLPQACFEIHSSLLHHYRISCTDNDEALELEIHAEAGQACVTVDPAASCQSSPASDLLASRAS